MVAEAVGTFFLVLIGPGTAMVNAFSDGAVGHVGVSLAFGFVVSAMIYALGHLSGPTSIPRSPSPSGRFAGFLPARSRPIWPPSAAGPRWPH
jgi:hypothetical protein